ncbi:MAG TPA: hypothetical protein VK866_08615 [Acidimicrobiales bacterium]|nr:hypothetical protein [Acidimicrobiales bacterium]
METTERTSSDPAVVAAIDRIRASLDGELVDRSRVVDHLLDLRLLAADDGATLSTVAAVDQLLVDLPGRTLVERTWVDDALTRLAASPS